MLLAYICINISWLFVWHYFIWKEIRLHLWDAIKDVAPYAVIAAGCMCTTYFITLSIVNLYLLLGVKIAIAAGLYVVCMKLSNSVTFKEAVNYLLKKG